MSTCPDDAIHHLFVDGEIPAEHLSAYRQHADSCPDCKKKILRIRALRNRLHSDSAEKAFFSENFDESFDLLMAKMRFRTVSREIQKNETSYVIRRILPWAAAVIITVSGVYAFLQTGGMRNAQIAQRPFDTAQPAGETVSSGENGAASGDSAVIAIREDAFVNARPIAPSYAFYNPQSMGVTGGLSFVYGSGAFRRPFVSPNMDLRVYVLSDDGIRRVVIPFTFEVPAAEFALRGTVPDAPR